MSQNTIALKIKNRAQSYVRCFASASSTQRIYSSSFSLPPPIPQGGGEVKKTKNIKRMYPKSIETLRICYFHHKQSEIEKHANLVANDPFEDAFEDLYQVSQMKKEYFNEIENRLIFRKKLLHVGAEVRTYYRYHILCYEKRIIMSFLGSYIKAMSKKTREVVMDRLKTYSVDPSLFDLGSFQKLVHQIQHLISFLDEKNEIETYYGVFRLLKRNLIRFWYYVGMNQNNNLDFTWNNTLNDLCKLKEEEERLINTEKEKEIEEKNKVDEGKKKFREALEKLKNKKTVPIDTVAPPSQSIHTCSFFERSTLKEYKEIHQQNQNLVCLFLDTYTKIMNDPNTVVV